MPANCGVTAADSTSKNLREEPSVVRVGASSLVLPRPRGPGMRRPSAQVGVTRWKDFSAVGGPAQSGFGKAPPLGGAWGHAGRRRSSRLGERLLAIRDEPYLRRRQAPSEPTAAGDCWGQRNEPVPAASLARDERIHRKRGPARLCARRSERRAQDANPPARGNPRGSAQSVSAQCGDLGLRRPVVWMAGCQSERPLSQVSHAAPLSGRR